MGLTFTLLPQRNWPATPERAVGTGLEIRVDIVNIGSKVRIISEALHDRNSLPLAIANDTPECFDIGQCIDQRRSEARTNAILPMAVIAACMKAPVTVVGLRIDFAVDDAVELGGGRMILRSRANTEDEARHDD